MAKTKFKDLAINGGEPEFKRVIPVGQMNFPEWEKFEEKFRGIFARRYYTNYGPLLAELEKKLESFLGVKHVICMTNATIALIILAKALELKGKVITPAFSFIATAQSLSWAALEPVFCDVDVNTHLVDANQLERLIDKHVTGILAVNLWGASADYKALKNIADNAGVKLYFDSAQGFGCSRDGVNLANFAEASVFSFHATKILNAAEGGCIATNNDELAEKIRNIRSSYGVRATADVEYTSNARMSEAQAAMALLSLDDYSKNQKRNESYYHLYQKLLKDVEGLKIYQPDLHGESNYQYVVIELDEKKFGISRDKLVEILKAENVLSRRYFRPGIHRTTPYYYEYPQYVDALPNTDALCVRVFQLPSGQDVDFDKIERICEIVKLIQKNSKFLL